MFQQIRPVTYDNTMLTTADACKRRLCLFLAGLEPVGTPSYFTFGRVWQEALEVWYVTEGPTEVKLAASGSMPTAAAPQELNASSGYGIESRSSGFPVAAIRSS